MGGLGYSGFLSPVRPSDEKGRFEIVACVSVGRSDFSVVIGEVVRTNKYKRAAQRGYIDNENNTFKT